MRWLILMCVACVACGGTVDPQTGLTEPSILVPEAPEADAGSDVCYPAKQACPLPDAGAVCESLASAPNQCGGMASTSWYLCPFTATSPVGQCVPGGSDNSGQYWCCQ